MATTIQPPEIKRRDDSTPPVSHDGGGRGPRAAAGNLRYVEDSSPASRTGIWVGLAAITMTFAAFTSAMIVRQASLDWRHFSLPPILLLNTAILLASGVTLEFARRRVAAFVHGITPSRDASMLWLRVTLGLGLLFVAGQYVAWLQLKAQGLYLATNPASSFFYLFTGVHVIHVIGGLAGLTLAIWRLGRRVPTLRVSTLSTVAYYWHFMGLLWIYLLLLLWTRI
jgi:cytochrome c oxidase subunit 3